MLIQDEYIQVTSQRLRTSHSGVAGTPGRVCDPMSPPLCQSLAISVILSGSFGVKLRGSFLPQNFQFLQYPNILVKTSFYRFFFNETKIGTTRSTVKPN